MNFSELIIQDKALFVTYGGGHAAALAPVMSNLERMSIDYRALALTTSKSYLASHGIKALSMKDVADRVEGYRRVQRVGKILAREQTQHSSISIEDTEAYLGVGFHALVRSFGLQKARAIYSDSGRQLFRPVDFFRSWFTQNRPAVVIATSAPRSERAALEAARELGIPSVCLVDLYAPFEIEWCASPGYASKICVLNDAVAQRFNERGVPTERLAVTGNPAFDRLTKLDVKQLRRDARSALGIKNEEYLVSWMSQPEPGRHPFSGAVGDPSLPQRIEKFLVDGLKDRSHINLVLRRHPSEDRAKDFGGPRVRFSDVTQSLDELLCASDCVITCSSTVGLEAALLGIPVIQCMDSIFSPDLPLAELGFAQAVNSHQLLWPVIDDVLANAPFNSTVRLPASDASSAGERIAEIILQLLTHEK
jgi:hypothetical protein